MKFLICALVSSFSAVSFAAPKAPVFQVDKAIETQRLMADLKMDADASLQLAATTQGLNKTQLEITKADQQLKQALSLFPPANHPYSLYP